MNRSASGQVRMWACVLAGCILFTTAPGWAKITEQETPKASPGLPLVAAPATTKPPDPAALPPLVLTAIDELFKIGLPDPRGCEYREIEIAESPTWKIKAHGWVLPAKGAKREAIGWNGVIYPIASVGAPVDLRKEIEAIYAGARRFRGYGVGWPLDDPSTLNLYGALPLQVAFMVRLGEMKLAVDAWNDGYADAPELKTQDPFAGMADTWINCRFNQAIAAYLNGDYNACLRICQEVSATQTKVTAEIARRKSALPSPPSKGANPLWQLPVLQAEAERRLNEKPFTLVLESGQPAGGPERIATLIRDLETVRVIQEMNPGETDPLNDPVVQELIKQGHAAVEPLIQCLAGDNRLHGQHGL